MTRKNYQCPDAEKGSVHVLLQKKGRNPEGEYIAKPFIAKYNPTEWESSIRGNVTNMGFEPFEDDVEVKKPTVCYTRVLSHPDFANEVATETPVKAKKEKETSDSPKNEKDAN